jgi:molybdenum cofactor cytidylyltransferase
VSVAVVLLAAGAGRRWDGEGHKLLAEFRGRPVVSWAAGAALAAGLDAVAVVTGAVDLTGALPEGIDLLDNPRWEDGQSSSLQVAVGWATAAGHEAIVVGLGDQPLVPAEAYRAVARSTSPIAIATFDGAPRPPTRLASSVWPLLPTEGDEGARVVIARHPELVELVPCAGEAIDIDTLADLKRQP